MKKNDVENNRRDEDKEGKLGKQRDGSKQRIQQNEGGQESQEKDQKNSKMNVGKRSTKASNTSKTSNIVSINPLQGILDPSEMDVPGRTNADNYIKAVGKYKLLPNTVILSASNFLHQPSALAIEEMIKHFDARLVEPLKVVKKGSMYELIDGVKTFNALCELHKRLGISNFDVMCRIYDKLTEEDQARVYAKQDEQHSNLPIGYKIRALEIAKDPEVLEFLDKTRESGFEIRPGDHRPRNGYIAAIGTAFKVFQWIGSAAYLRMLKIVHKTWAGEKWSVTKHMLVGMAQFLKTHDVDINSFSRMFRHVSYEEIFIKTLEFPGMTRDGAYASAIADKFAELIAKAKKDEATAGN